MKYPWVDIPPGTWGDYVKRFQVGHWEGFVADIQKNGVRKFVWVIRRREVTCQWGYGRTMQKATRFAEEAVLAEIHKRFRELAWTAVFAAAGLLVFYITMRALL